MEPDLPKPIALYFAAVNAGDIVTLERCFADDAVVRDERQHHVGPAAIAAWAADTKAKYNHTVAPLEAESAEATLVKGRVSGNFPGSPIVLTYRFHLAGDKIGALEIG